VEERKAVRRAIAKEQAEKMTFAEAARLCHEKKLPEFKNEKHAKQWMTTLETYASPVIGEIAVADIELPHILGVLEPIWTKKTETASRVRQRIEQTLTWATVSGYRFGENPARWKGNLDAVLPKPSKVKKKTHYAALPWQEIGSFMQALRSKRGMAGRCLEFIILTAARSGEARLATWEEIDLEKKVWTVPAERMKAGKEHKVPLTEDAITLLKKLPRLEGSPYVFPAARGGALSDMAVSMVCRRMQVEAVPHGFRSSFRDWAAESTNFPREVVEMALAHTIENAVEAAYRRGDLFEKRRRLMDAWAGYCGKVQDKKPASLTPIRGGAAK
jgi:integrase